MRASKTPVDNLLLETWFRVTSKGLTLTVARGKKNKTKLPLTSFNMAVSVTVLRYNFDVISLATKAA